MKLLILDNPHTRAGTFITAEHLKQIKSVDKKLEIVLVENQVSKIQPHLANTEILLSNGFPTIPVHSFSKLRWVQVTSAGVNMLPQALFDSEILITNASGVHPIPIAEQVFGYMLMFSRQLHTLHRQQIVKKQWIQNSSLPVDELFGKTVAIIGMGRIGEQVAVFANAFGMRVIAVTRTKHRKSKYVQQSLLMKDLQKAISQADYVINCLPSTHETRHTFTSKQFQSMKKAAYFINIGRGDTVKEQDLIAALKKHTISGAGLDVTEVEPLSSTSELWKLENVIITPHTAGWTPHYMDRVIDIFCENLRAFKKGKKMTTQVDKKLGY